MTLSDEVKKLLDGPNFAHLATLMTHGSPPIRPVWGGREADPILIATRESSLQARNTRRDARAHGLHHRDRAGQHAGVVAAAAGDRGVLVVHVHRALLAHDRGRRLERHSEIDGLAVGDAALHAARAVRARAHALVVHVELV